MIKRMMLIGLLALLLFGAVFTWRFMQIKQAKEGHRPPPPPTVAVTEVKREMWQPFYSAIGSLVAARGIEVSNDLPGKVARIHFESGQFVEAGRLLIELDTATEEAELARLEAARGLASIQYKRAAELVSTSHVSKSNYDESKALLAQAEASVLSQKTLIEKNRIRAPFSGKLGIRRVDVGQYLPTGTPIVPLEALDPLYVDFSLPERYFARLAPGQVVEIYVQAYPERSFEGVVSALNPGIDLDTRNITLRANLDNKEELLRPGMFARVVIRLGDKEDVLTLPDSAITFNTYGDSVFLVIENEVGHTVERRQVNTGQTRDGRIEIVAGLKAGQMIVSAGQVKLRNGIPVLLDDQPAPGERLAGDEKDLDGDDAGRGKE